MITKDQVKSAAREYAERNKTGWSEYFTMVEETQKNGEKCFVVRTSNVDTEGKSWMEIDFSTPVNI